MAQKCEEIRELLPAYEDGELDSGDRRRVESHLAGCPACAREAVWVREAVARARALPVPDPSAEFWEAFGASLDRRIAEEPPPCLPLWRRVTAWGTGILGLRPIPALSAAAVLGILLAIGLVRAPRAPNEAPVAEVLTIGGEWRIGQNLDVLEQLDLLEEMDLLEQLPSLLAPENGRRSGMMS